MNPGLIYFWARYSEARVLRGLPFFGGGVCGHSSPRVPPAEEERRFSHHATATAREPARSLARPRPSGRRAPPLRYCSVPSSSHARSGRQSLSEGPSLPAGFSFVLPAAWSPCHHGTASLVPCLTRGQCPGAWPGLWGDLVGSIQLEGLGARR